jgi:hypothetical protein
MSAPAFMCAQSLRAPCAIHEGQIKMDPQEHVFISLVYGSSTIVFITDQSAPAMIKLTMNDQGTERQKRRHFARSKYN